jgi:hypothetical protein
MMPVYSLLPCSTFLSTSEIERLVNELQPSRLVRIRLGIAILIIESKGKSVCTSYNRKVGRPDQASILGRNWSQN